MEVFEKKLENLGMVYEIAKFVIVIKNLAEIFLGSRAEIWDRPSTRGRIGRKPVRGGGPAGRAGASGLGRSDFRAGGSDLGGSDFRSGAGEAEAPTKSQRKYPEESGPFQKNVAGNNAGIIENCRESAYFAENALRQLVKTSPN